MIFLLSIAGVMIILILFYKFIFLRDPERTIPTGAILISPADGKIISIQEYDLTQKNPTVTKGNRILEPIVSDVSTKGTIISIFMNVCNVHVNRSPIAGTIEKVQHVPGKYHIASQPEALTENEHCSFLIKGKHTIKVMLIAGLVARRIVPKVHKGDKVTQGERIGKILLGSQVSLIIPSGIKVKANVGDKVRAGESIIG